jgi:pantoate--beta-alanine ligase
MQIIEDLNNMQETAIRLRSGGKLIALASTSGALHAGHAALVRKAREEADVVVLAAIVNPREFGPNEDYQRYPRDRDGDARFCEAEGVDILFRPAPEALYPAGHSLSVNEDAVSAGLCGISRPHYFRGVCTLHAILFNLVRPDQIVLGQRDAQKAVVIRKLVEELHFPVSVMVEPTVRDADGVPFNARNRYLNDFQRRDAATLYKALLEGHKLVEQGIRNVDRILAEVTHHISQVRRLRVIYVAAVDPESMEPVRGQIAPGRTLVMAAVWCDEVRLIDNILL